MCVVCGVCFVCGLFLVCVLCVSFVGWSFEVFCCVLCTNLSFFLVGYGDALMVVVCTNQYAFHSFNKYIYIYICLSTPVVVGVVDEEANATHFMHWVVGLYIFA